MNRMRRNLRRKLIKLFIIFSILCVDAVCLYAGRIEWSWRDIKLGVTTETEIWKHLGEPSLIILFPKDYLRIKKGENPKEIIFRYRYTILNIKDDLLFLKRTPLSISDEIISIEGNFVFNDGTLKSYSIRYNFMPNKSLSREKYVKVFSQLLGEPIKYEEQMKILTYYFRNHFSLTFWPDPLSKFVMELQCHPRN